MAPEDRDPICDQLRDARLRKGWSLQDMANRGGPHTSVISSYERGDRNPPLSQLRKWAEALDHEVRVVGPSDGRVTTWSEYAVVFNAFVDGRATLQRIECGDLAEGERIHNAIPASRLLQRLVTAGDWETV
jgi:transcriptional regulator with XRE-family HTH domain